MITEKKLSLEELSTLREIVDKSERPYIAWENLSLRDALSFQKSVVEDTIQLLQYATRQPELELDIPVEGLYFAFMRYSQLAEELEARLEDV